LLYKCVLFTNQKYIIPPDLRYEKRYYLPLNSLKLLGGHSLQSGFAILIAELDLVINDGNLTNNEFAIPIQFMKTSQSQSKKLSIAK